MALVLLGHSITKDSNTQQGQLKYVYKYYFTSESNMNTIPKYIYNTLFNTQTYLSPSPMYIHINQYFHNEI